MSKTALITGITGQDGSYLAELLLEKGYRVVGMIHTNSKRNMARIQHLEERIELYNADLLNQTSIIQLVDSVEPDELYNLAAQSFVPLSWDQPILTAECTALGVVRILDAIREVNPGIRFYQASSSEMFGQVQETPQTETTPFNPRSPYGVAKVYGHYAVINYRNHYDLFACSGILFNHESPRRSRQFVTRKVSSYVARIKLGLAGKLKLGNLNASRDWGFAGDYVKAMWLMLQQEQPQDYVVGTGCSHTVRDLVRLAFKRVNLDWREHVRTDSSLMRPVELKILVANPKKAWQELGWSAQTDFEELVSLMVDTDMELLSRS